MSSANDNPGAESGVEPEGFLAARFYLTVFLTLLVVALCIPAVHELASALGHNTQTAVVSPVQPRSRKQLANAPELQVDPTAERQALQRSTSARLHGYGYVDRAHGFVHVPIERAMGSSRVDSNRDNQQDKEPRHERAAE